jgi:esterase/lipase superfamily enzyme
LKRLIKRTDDRVKLLEIDLLAKSHFVDLMRSSLSNRPNGERATLIYIHGYNVDFVEAATRAAQIGFDLKVDGEVAFFSWASKGERHSYVADSATLRASELELEEFVGTILDNPATERVNILAHSMGNQALLRVMERLRHKRGDVDIGRIVNIILAAPDVDIDEFRKLASVYTSVARRTTLYISSKDLALKSSGILNDYPRAGLIPPVTIVPGIDSIEVSGVDLTVLGHSYFAEAAPVLYDMKVLLKSNQGPEQRIRLIKKTENARNQVYWAIRP